MSLKSLDVENEEKRIQSENDSLNRTEEERIIEESPENAEKTYTQAEVNEIIRERLRRERAKTAPTPEEAQAAELTARELKLQQKIWLNDQGLPVDDVVEFFEAIDLGSMEGFESTIRSLLDIGTIISTYAEQPRQLEALGIGSGSTRGVPTERSILKQIFAKGGRF